ncbi:MAG: FtsQ-type POTRA domain-containing protein [Rhizobiales bacterium]|nr:FtsQ-type POTRA domain-containing protein [Hyphomicrobiales bacterium]
MDDRGCLAQPLNRAPHAAPALGTAKVLPRRRNFRHLLSVRGAQANGRLALIVEHLTPILELNIPRGAGFTAAIAIIGSAALFGVVRGGHVSSIVAQFEEARDAAANALGFQITEIAFFGQQQVSRNEILATAGITNRNSLLFLDADTTRAQLKSNPWISDATILKLYPDRLQITVREREAFALWQESRKVSVIAADGTVLEPQVTQRFAQLPLVVGRGAANRASDFLALLDRYPAIRSQVRAAILVAERRWNLRLKNGIDVRLPESGVETALDRLIALDRDKKLLSRDIVAIDLRLADRVTVRLSDEAALIREEALQEKKVKRKGSAV